MVTVSQSLVISLMTTGIILFFLAAIYYTYMERGFSKVSQIYEPIPPMRVLSPTLTGIIKEYSDMLTLIQGAATVTEIAYLTDRVLDWDAANKASGKTDEYFIDLMKELEARELKLRSLKTHS